jgi:hypothetical protein
VIQLAVPGQQASTRLGVEDMRASGDVPNMARQFFEAWGYQGAHPDFVPRAVKVD